MTREETLAWARSLKPGDKVIYDESWCDLCILEVEKVTPTGWVKTTNGKTFSQTSWFDSLRCRGGNGEIVPITDALLQKIEKQKKEHTENVRKRNIINCAKNIIYNEYRHIGDMTYDHAEKIIAAFERINGDGDHCEV